MILAERHLTKCHIVISKKATQPEKLAAHELRQFLRAVADTSFPLSDDVEWMNSNKAKQKAIAAAARAGDSAADGGNGFAQTNVSAILIGSEAYPNRLISGIDYAQLGDEGFIIKTEGDTVIIAGRKPRGVMYGIYGFLEDYIGIRFYTKDFTYIPKRETLRIPDEINDIQTPALEYRDPFYGQNFDPDWHVRNKSNTTMSNLEVMHGGKMKYVGFVHTFDSLVPVAKYFDSHPEYFSMINGERISNRTQLCLTNPDVFNIAVAEVRKRLKKNPDANIISVSQNDWANSCECPDCAAMDKSAGSKSGSLLYFVNKIAQAIEEEYPHVIVDTLAYQYTRKAPKKIKPRKNVAVRLCSIECCFAHPLAECNVNASFRERDWTKANFKSFTEDLRDWAKICSRLHIWDYVTNFAHYLNPFPNFKVLKENINFFIENKVTGIFEEGNTAGSAAAELNHLRQYLLAKLLWNPALDVDRIVDEFLSIYFGGASQAIREYYDLIHAQITPDTHMGIYDLPVSAYYPESMLCKAESIFDRAEMLANDDQTLHRVKLCRLSIDYLKMARMPFGSEERDAAIDRIIDAAGYYGLEQIREGRDLETWRIRLKEEPFKPVNA